MRQKWTVSSVTWILFCTNALVGYQTKPNAQFNNWRKHKCWNNKTNLLDGRRYRGLNITGRVLFMMRYGSSKFTAQLATRLRIVRLCFTCSLLKLVCLYLCNSRYTLEFLHYSAGAFPAAAVWGGQWGGHICIWGGENSGWHNAWLSELCNLTPATWCHAVNTAVM